MQQATGRGVRRGPALWLAPVAVVVLAGASSPWVAQRAPRFFFPALAAAGGALVVVSLVRALVRFVRRRRGEEPVSLLPLAANIVAAVLLVVLPLTHLLRAMTPPGAGAPRIHTGFGAWLGSEGYPLPSSHRGIDVAGAVGGDVIAAVDGRVSVARDNRDLCGLIVVIDHAPGPYRTVYCHFSAIAVQVGDRVQRGQRVGAIGTSEQRAFPGFEHVHLELQRGRDPKDIEDPLPRIVGCFDGSKPYPTDRLVLTYPVKC
jgi:murein DD-endopeptidase MepM/ murein hydrolase activator NlpD